MRPRQRRPRVNLHFVHGFPSFVSTRETIKRNDMHDEAPRINIDRQTLPAACVVKVITQKQASEMGSLTGTTFPLALRLASHVFRIRTLGGGQAEVTQSVENAVFSSLTGTTSYLAFFFRCVGA